MNEIIHLSVYAYAEIIFGLIVFWIGFYLTSKNPSSILTWIVMGFLFGFTMTTFSEPILLYSRSLKEYIFWQNVTDWPLFLSPIFMFHASVLLSSKDKKQNKNLLIAGYLLAIFFYICDIRGGLILKENVLRFSDYRRYDGFAPGVLLIPSVIFTIVYLLLSFRNYAARLKEDSKKFLMPAVGSLFFALTGVFTILSYYVVIPAAGWIFGLGTGFGTLFYIYSMFRYHLYLPSEKIIFDRTFFYRTIVTFFILTLYWICLKVSGIKLTYETLLLIVLTIPLILFTHTFYDWISTFINDLVYNRASGLSVVNDEEVSQALKNYSSPDKLEDSSLLRLNIIKSRTSKMPVDSLREKIKDAIEYFKTDENRRTKRNLKYHLLKMIALDQAEEGQILWELGFDEYPVRVMTNSSKNRPPLFQVTSPSDYTYISRNAYLALKKEAIHDVTWRISYLEKQAPKKFY